MRTLHSIVSEMARTGSVVKVDASRREIAKMRNGSKAHRMTTTQMMAHPRTHEHKVRWPVRDSAPTLEQERKIRDARLTENPMITARRRQHPDTRKK